MIGELFQFLDGISPWWWVAFALAIGALEVMTFTYYLLWPAAAALSIAVALFVSPDLSGTTQAVLFAILTLLYAVIGWGVVKRAKSPDGTAENGLNQRSSRLIGRRAKVSGGFESGMGWVTIDGERWRARLKDPGNRPADGADLNVVGAEGMTLVVSTES